MDFPAALVDLVFFGRFFTEWGIMGLKVSPGGCRNFTIDGIWAARLK
jgi:hypothetical protein